MKYLIIIVTLVLTTLTSRAQNTTDSTIEEQTFTITESYKFRPEVVVKTPFHAQLEKDNVRRQNSVNFVLEPQSLYYPYLPLATNPLAYNNTIQRDSLDNYIKVGYGNYERPLVKTGLVLNSKKRSPIDLNFLYDRSKGPERLQIQQTIAADVTTQIPIRTIDDIELYGKVSAEKRNLYGVPDFNSTPLLSSTFISNNWLNTHFGAKFLNGNASETRHYHFQPAVELITTRNSFGSAETRAMLSTNLGYVLNRKFRVNINPFFNYQTIKGRTRFNNSIGGLKSTAYWEQEKYRAEGTLELNTLEEIFFLQSTFWLQIMQNKAHLEVSLGKDYTQNSLSGFYSQNNFLRAIDSIENTTRSFISSSIHATPGPLLDASLYFKFERYDDFSYFINTTSEIGNNYFDVNYVDQFNWLKFGTELKLKIRDKYDLYTRFQINSYNMDLSDRIAYLPRFEAQAKIQLPLLPKLDSYFALLYYSSRQDYVDYKVKNLSQYLDMGLGFQYNFKEKLRFWLDIGNLLNQELDYYYHYPSIGTNFRGGLLYLF